MHLLLVFISSICITLSGTTDTLFEQIEKGFNERNAAQIIQFAKANVMMSILGKEAVYSKQQSIQLLKDFFAKKSLEEFKFTFKGKETSEGLFAIGTYKMKEGEYRVSIHFVHDHTTYVIERLTIE